MSSAPCSSVICAILCACCIVAGCMTPEPVAGSRDTPESEVTKERTVLSTPTVSSGELPDAPFENIPRTGTTVVTPATSATIALIPEARLNSLIRDCRNKLAALKQSDAADTIVKSGGSGSNTCESTMSRELGYLIDATDGNVSFFKGEYGSIGGDMIVPLMNKSHAYVFLHSHPKNSIRCSNGTYRTTIRTLNSFSLQDLVFAGELTSRGHHIIALYAISDSDYEIYPKTNDGWKNWTVINNTVAAITEEYGPGFVNDVDNAMPILAVKLDYRYLIDNRVLV